ncbi:MAG: response regulator [Rhodopila sp.]
MLGSYWQEAPASAGTAQPARIPDAAAPAATVLVVEDEERIREMIAMLLTEQGYSVIEAEDGPAGLSVVQSAARLDLLLTDIGLPGLNGRQLADAARVRRPGLPVLLITGYAGAAMDDADLPPEMEVLRKPFTFDKLTDRVRALIEDLDIRTSARSQSDSPDR